MIARYTHRAQRDLEKLPVKDRQQLVGAVDRLAAHGIGDVRALGGPWRGRYRLRVGDWRAIFRREDGVVVLRVRHRREAYR